jgi:CBS domain-containing protein/protein required for attachment to host cells
MNAISQSTENQTGGLMYRFLEYTAGQYMTRAVMTVTRRITLRELEELFEKHDFNSFPVVEDGRLLGLMTKFDFLKAFAFTTGQMVPHYEELMNRQVLEMMTEAVVHVEPTAPLTRVLEMMVNLKTRSFPVIGAGRELVGMISREDVMRAPGRVHQSMGPARSAVEQTDWHDQEEQAFLKALASRLHVALSKGETRALIMVTAPRALGVLREVYSPAVRKAIRAELGKDLVNVPIHEIEKQLSVISAIHGR